MPKKVSNQDVLNKKFNLTNTYNSSIYQTKNILQTHSGLFAYVSQSRLFDKTVKQENRVINSNRCESSSKSTTSSLVANKQTRYLRKQKTTPFLNLKKNSNYDQKANLIDSFKSTKSENFDQIKYNQLEMENFLNDELGAGDASLKKNSFNEKNSYYSEESQPKNSYNAANTVLSTLNTNLNSNTDEIFNKSNYSLFLDILKIEFVQFNKMETAQTIQNKLLIESVSTSESFDLKCKMQNFDSNINFKEEKALKQVEMRVFHFIPIQVLVTKYDFYSTRVQIIHNCVIFYNNFKKIEILNCLFFAKKIEKSNLLLCTTRMKKERSKKFLITYSLIKNLYNLSKRN